MRLLRKSESTPIMNSQSYHVNESHCLSCINDLLGLLLEQFFWKGSSTDFKAYTVKKWLYTTIALRNS